MAAISHEWWNKAQEFKVKWKFAISVLHFLDFNSKCYLQLIELIQNIFLQSRSDLLTLEEHISMIHAEKICRERSQLIW